jgi:hypothetical protein
MKKLLHFLDIKMDTLTPSPFFKKLPKITPKNLAIRIDFLQKGELFGKERSFFRS